MIVLRSGALAIALASGLVAQTTSGNANPREFTKPTLLQPVFFFAAPNPAQANLYVRPGASSPYDLLASFPVGAGMSGPSELTATGMSVFFSADDSGGAGEELWISNGTAIGTQLVADVRPGPIGSRPQQLTDFRAGMFLFTADDGTHGRELWLTDGTGPGTVMLKDIFLGPTSSSPLEITVVGTEAFFSATDSLNGRELWKTDGTPGGTVRVTDIALGPAGSFPSSLARLGIDLLYAADDGTNGTELWKTNTVSSATSLVLDIHPTGASRPQELTAAFGRLYFTADDGANGAEVWESDGTALGTVLAADIAPGPGVGSNPYGYAANATSLWFAANDGTTGFEPWRIDTVGVSNQIADIRFGPASSHPEQQVVLGPDVLFTADDGLIGRELYRATAGGALLVKDIRPGPCGSGITSLSVPASVAMFAADDGTVGHELWESSGTNATTTLAAQINLSPDVQPQLDHAHAEQSGQHFNTFKIDGVDAGASAFVMVSSRAASPLDLGPFLGIQTSGEVTIDLGAFWFAIGPATASPLGIATLPLAYPSLANAYEIVTQGISFTASKLELTNNLAVCQGKIDMSGAGCPPGTYVKVTGRYVDDRLDYCLTMTPSSPDVEWVVFVKVFADGSCKEIGRKKMTGDTIGYTIVKSLKLGEHIEARFYCGKPHDDCSATGGYVACKLGC